MSPLTWLLLAALLLGAVIVLLSWTAGRLDRMHIRLATARASLDRQLVDRAAATVRVATSGPTDPASAMVLVGAAEEARTSAGTGAHGAHESALSQALRAVLGDEAVVSELWRNADGPDRAALSELAAACERVRLARGFHDDLVARTQAMRLRRLVRWFRLAGHAPWPTPYLVDDELPQGLVRVSADGSADESPRAGGP